MTRGKYIIFSGGEGSGKSTIINRLAEHWPNVLLTREPGAMLFGQSVRELILRADFALAPWAEFYLFMADRANHMDKLVRPTLDRGQHVLSDRGFPETFAYQLYTGLGIEDPTEYLQTIMQHGWPWPDLWVLLDIDPVIGLQRRRLGGQVNRIDQREQAYHEKVREGFHRIAKHASFPVEVIDASQSIEQVFDQARQRIEQTITV